MTLSVSATDVCFRKGRNCWPSPWTIWRRCIRHVRNKRSSTVATDTFCLKTRHESRITYLLHRIWFFYYYFWNLNAFFLLFFSIYFAYQAVSPPSSPPAPPALFHPSIHSSSVSTGKGQCDINIEDPEKSIPEAWKIISQGCFANILKSGHR